MEDEVEDMCKAEEPEVGEEAEDGEEAEEAEDGEVEQWGVYALV